METIESLSQKIQYSEENKGKSRKLCEIDGTDQVYISLANREREWEMIIRILQEFKEALIKKNSLKAWVYHAPGCKTLCHEPGCITPHACNCGLWAFLENDK